MTTEAHSWGWQKVLSEEGWQDDQTPQSYLVTGEYKEYRPFCSEIFLFYVPPHDTVIESGNTGIEKGLTKAVLFQYSHKPLLWMLLFFFFLVRWWFLYSSCSPEPTTSSALKLSLHPILKYIMLPIQICQGFYCICISNMIKSFSGLTFFPWRQLQIEYFFPCYLFLPFQSNVTLRLQITQYQKRGNDPLLPSFPHWLAERLSFAFPSQAYT